MTDFADSTEPPDAAAQDAPPPRRRTAYLVLGMHRSGTSAMTQVLALAGCDLPTNVMPGDEHNAKGYFEPWRIAMLNNQRLRAGGGAWDDPFVHPYVPLSEADERGWIEQAASLFSDEYGASPNPLVKDPRVTVLAPMWRAALEGLGLDLRVVVPVRHPLEVAGSLARRNGFAVEKSLLLWSAYMLAAEAFSRGLPRAFVPYDGLLADWRGQIARIEAAHGAPLPGLDEAGAQAIDGFLTGELRHHQAQDELTGVPISGPLTAQVHDWFVRAAHDETSGPRPLDQAAARLAEMKAAMGVLVSPVTSELDAVRNELLEARQLAEFAQARRLALEQEHGEVEAILSDLLGEA